MGRPCCRPPLRSTRRPQRRDGFEKPLIVAVRRADEGAMTGSVPLPRFPDASPGYDPVAVDSFVTKLLARARAQAGSDRSEIEALRGKLSDAVAIITAQEDEIAELTDRLDAHVAAGVAPPVMAADVTDVIEEVTESPFRPLEREEVLTRAQEAEKAIRGRFLSSVSRSN